MNRACRIRQIDLPNGGGMRPKMNKVVILVIFIAFVCVPCASATSVDRLYMCNLEGHAGDTIAETITLEGTTSSARAGHWYTFYKDIEGDNEARMNITSWMTITPRNYTLVTGETKAFTVAIEIPKDAVPALYGATSESANAKGHSNERRTYIIFEDMDASVAEAGGHGLASGLMIPVSVKVLGKPNPLTPIIELIQANIVMIMLLAIIVILLVVLLRRQGGKRQEKEVEK